MVLERAGADAIGGKQDDGNDRGLDAQQDSGNRRHIAIGHVDPRQADQHKQRRQNEECAGDDSAKRLVHQPSNIYGELLSLRAGQHHAVIQGMEETLFGDPAFLLDQILMHDCNLAGRAAETDASEPEPIHEGFGQADVCGRCGGSVIGIHVQNSPWGVADLQQARKYPALWYCIYVIIGAVRLLAGIRLTNDKKNRQIRNHS